MCITRVKLNRSINNFKKVTFSIISSHKVQHLLKSFKEAAISLRHLGKSILEENIYLGPLEII